MGGFSQDTQHFAILYICVVMRNEILLINIFSFILFTNFQSCYDVRNSGFGVSNYLNVLLLFCFLFFRFAFVLFVCVSLFGMCFRLKLSILCFQFNISKF